MSVAEQLVAAFEPWLTDDLQDYLEVIGEMFELVETYSDDASDDDGDHPGLTIVLDPDRAPVDGLPYLAQYVGERLAVGLTEAAQREWIKDAPNQQRGTVDSIAAAARRYLTGLKLVGIIERDTGADRLTVITFTDQTPDRDAVLRELYTVIPADISFTYVVAAGATWGQVSANFADWAAVSAAFTDWGALAGYQVGGTVIGP
jgi:hypothetical protein